MTGRNPHGGDTPPGPPEPAPAGPPEPTHQADGAAVIAPQTRGHQQSAAGPPAPGVARAAPPVPPPAMTTRPAATAAPSRATTTPPAAAGPDPAAGLTAGHGPLLVGTELVGTERAGATAGAAGLTAATAVADGAPDAPPDRPRGTVYSGVRPIGERVPRRDGARAGVLRSLRIGSHTASDGALAQLELATPGVGLVLGHDADQRLVAVRLFRPEPTRVTLIGGGWLCQLLMLRTLALGARVAIVAAQPDSWKGFGEWATGRKDRAAVFAADALVPPPASLAEPALVVYDLGSLGPSAPADPAPWRTELTVLPQLTGYGEPVVQESNLIILQRLTADEAQVARSALRLSKQTEQLVQTLGDDMVAILGAGANRYAWLAPSAVERLHLADPRR
jgi:hypothetical protein